jgi:hypothetical protein
LARHSEALFCYTLGHVVDESGAFIADFVQHRDWPTEEIHEVLPYLLDVNQILASSVMFRVGSVRFEPSLRYCGDWVAALRLAQQGPGAFVNEPLTFWRQHQSNASKDLAKTIGEEIRIRSQILESAKYFEECCKDKSLARERLARCAMDLAAHLVLVGDLPKAREVLARSTGFGGGLSAWKRAASTYLPKAKVRAHLWPNIDSDEVAKSWRPMKPVNLLVK